MATDTNMMGQTGLLAAIERAGNRLPDPVFLFVYLILGLIVISVLCAWLGVNAAHPVLRDTEGAAVMVQATSLLSAENVARFWVEMPKTFTHFHPLGYVLVVMLGAGVAERSGFFGASIRAAVRHAPAALLTPVVAAVAMLSNHAADAGYVILIPVAAIIYVSAGRHPLAGVACAFAGVSGGFSANITPGALDALLFGITEAAVDGSGLAAGWTVNIAGNWWFIVALMALYLPIVWWVTDRIIEPRLGAWAPDVVEDLQAEVSGETDQGLQTRGLKRAGWAALAVIALWLWMVFGPGTPLLNDDQAAEGLAWYQKAAPLFGSLVAGFMVLFLATGWAYGSVAGTIRSSQDLIDMLTESMKDMGYYLVLAFTAAHFVAMFNWSNLGLIMAVHGANAIQASGLPLAVLLGLIVLFSGLLNLFVGSASAKWALLAPVLVPMLMLLGISPEGATAAYRVGDSATNMITPLMVYFPLVLIFARRWQRDFGLGSLTAMMLPYAVWMLISGIALVMLWIGMGWDFGPGAAMSFELQS